MRLIGSTNSPYVRKVRVVIAELSLQQRVAFDVVDPRDPAHDLGTHNPLRKVPTLVGGEGRELFDSPVICHWFAATFDGGERLLPARGDARWRILTTEALADGMLDAAILVRQELQRPEAERSQGWIDKQMATVDRVLARLEGDEAWRAGDADLGQITVGCALGWLSFRFPDHEWGKHHPALAAWSDGFSSLPSMQATRPSNT